jgi:hypothetical protein
MGGGDHLDPGVDGRIILKRILEWLEGGMDCIDLAEDRDRWRTFVNTVMKEFHKMQGTSCVAEDLLASQEGLCSM